jgi:hypothetical protein
LTRFSSRFGAGGFRRFLDAGVYYESAFFAHAPTETAVGHATLFTGALPQAHGIVGNEWYDRVQKRRRFAVEDPQHRWLEHETPRDGGTSPRSMRVGTIGDEMSLASGRRALVYALSIKDRGAIPAAGFAGKAFWFDERSGDWVTSDYYYEKVPEFVRAFNKARLVEAQRGKAWDLLRPRAEYERRDADDRAFEGSYRTLGRTFPHPLAGEPPESFYAMLKRTPFADELTVQMLEALLEEQPIGRDEVTDLLALSFSATDYIGHVFGLESLEAEDNVLRLDRTLARMFEVLLARVPETELLAILSSDHGGCEAPEALRSLGLDADRHDPVGLIKRVNDGLEQQFGAGSRFVVDFSNPTLWLDEAAIAARSLALDVVERRAAELVLAGPGVAYALAKTDLVRGSVPRGPVYDRILNSFDRERTGNVYIVPKPGWLLATDPRGLTTMHGTPWRYDTHVPLAFFGNGLRAARVWHPVDPRDIASTIAARLAIEPPRGSSGQILAEVMTR